MSSVPASYRKSPPASACVAGSTAVMASHASLCVSAGAAGFMASLRVYHADEGYCLKRIRHARANLFNASSRRPPAAALGGTRLVILEYVSFHQCPPGGNWTLGKYLLHQGAVGALAGGALVAASKSLWAGLSGVSRHT